MRTSATNRRIRVLLSAIKDGTLIPRPEFQRRLVWVNRHKNAFIRTVLEGYPFPEIYIAAGEVDTETGKGTELLVDGQQRITTLNQYFIGSKDLNLEEDIPPYKDLDEGQKRDFLEYEVVIRDLGHKSTEEIREIFQRINSTNYALNAMEIHNARFDGEFKQFGEQLAQHNFFDENRVFRAGEIRRMSDVRFVLTFVVTIMSTYFNRDFELEAYLEKYNEAFPQQDQLQGEINQVFDFINQLNLDTKSRAWQKADLLTLLVEIHTALIRNQLALSPTEVRDNLLKFYSAVDVVEEEAEAGEEVNREVLAYRRATRQASNDRSSRITRGETLQKVINGSFRYSKS